MAKVERRRWCTQPFKPRAALPVPQRGACEGRWGRGFHFQGVFQTSPKTYTSCIWAYICMYVCVYVFAAECMRIPSDQLQRIVDACPLNETMGYCGINQSHIPHSGHWG